MDLAYVMLADFKVYNEQLINRLYHPSEGISCSPSLSPLFSTSSLFLQRPCSHRFPADRSRARGYVPCNARINPLVKSNLRFIIFYLSPSSFSTFLIFSASPLQLSLSLSLFFLLQSLCVGVFTCTVVTNAKYAYTSEE